MQNWYIQHPGYPGGTSWGQFWQLGTKANANQVHTMARIIEGVQKGYGLAIRVSARCQLIVEPSSSRTSA
jgi:hypothetical protein